MYSLTGLKARIRFFFLFITCLTAALLFSATSVEAASFTPHRYYDWNTHNANQQVLGIRAFAQDATPAATTTPTAGEYQNYEQHDYLLGFVSDATPTSPLYFMKKLEEGVTLALTFDAEAKEQTRLEIAGERLHEIEQVAESGNTNTLTSLAQDYQSTMNSVSDNLETLKEQGQDVVDTSQVVDTEAARHTLVLEEVIIKAPPQAEKGLSTALAASEKAVDTVADVLGKPAVPPDVITRLEALKAQGILTPEEVAKLVGVGSRQEARDEFRKYVDAKIFPEADFRKFDETARTKYPDGYFTVLEIKKFQEMRDLESARPDDATLGKLQDFAGEYKAGDIIPSDLRRWWVPMVRLEELQNTMRPDLLREDLFRYRPEDQQKYKEVVERMKPRAADVEHINTLITQNPNLLNDPSYARLKAIADKFGTSEAPAPNTAAAQACGRETHWVSIPFMPQGGYCVPNYNFPSPGTTGGTGGQSCPPGYHRTSPESACYPDNASGPGIIGSLPAQGTCPAGYRWTPAPQTGGYCSPEIPSTGGGFPSPIAVPGYCLPGQTFRDGKCETYNPPPPGGCAGSSYWNGQQCITPKDCGAGSYQDHTGACKPISETERRICPAPLSGCGFNAYWDTNTCSCKSTFEPFPQPSGPGGTYPTPRPGETYPTRPPGGTYPTPGGGGGELRQCTPPSNGCGTNAYFDYGSCSCRTSTQTTGGTTSGGNYQQCGSGYYWNGSYCAQSSGTYSQPSSSYTQPTYQPPSTTTTTQQQTTTTQEQTPTYQQQTTTTTTDQQQQTQTQTQTSEPQPQQQTQTQPTQETQTQQSAPTQNYTPPSGY